MAAVVAEEAEAVGAEASPAYDGSTMPRPVAGSPSTTRIQKNEPAVYFFSMASVMSREGDTDAWDSGNELTTRHEESV